MAEVGMSANPIGAHQVNHHRIDCGAAQIVVVLVRVKGVPWSMYGATIEYYGTPMTTLPECWLTARMRAWRKYHDVMTTGATAGACAKALKRAGAARVDVVTFARVVPGHE